MSGQTNIPKPLQKWLKVLQWRAGQLSGQTRRYRRQRCSRHPPFNGGPDNCPARLERMSVGTCCPYAFNGGPDNCPARREIETSIWAMPPLLQWRAGQLSGQTCGDRLHSQRGVMPSMEGRTIVRPDSTQQRSQAGPQRPFNGGPDNCPARHPQVRGLTVRSINLQWRAGQLSGQTRIISHICPNSAGPSMEGRTIVRPDKLHRTRRLLWLYSFNGGPDNCPARQLRLFSIQH